MIKSWRHKGLKDFFETGNKAGIIPEHASKLTMTRKPTHPGEVFLKDVLEPLGVTITDAAEMLGVTRKTLSEFVNEKSALSPEMAIRMATTPESWMVMQMKLTLWLAMQNAPKNVKVACFG